MNLAGVPGAVLAGVAPALVHHTYADLYTDPASDPFQGNYVNFYHEYSTAGGVTPAALRESLYNSGNAGVPIHILAHVRDGTADPADPGHIVGYHRLTRHVASYGQLPRPFDGQGHAFMGDVVDGQVPISVNVPDHLFNLLQVVQVPTAGRLEQLLQADPALQVVGPFAAGDPDVTATVVRGVIVVPSEYVRMFLTAGMRPRDAYLALSAIIQQRNHEVACEPLLDWLRVAMTRRGADAAPRTAIAPLQAPMYAPPEVHQVYLAYRTAVAHRDLPLLSPAGQQQGAHLIATGLTTLVQEQRLARQEAAEQRVAKEANKTPASYYGVLLERLMRWAQVHAEADLPPIHEAIANTVKSKIRPLLQKAVEDCLFNNNHSDDFPVSTAMATKVVELNWHTTLPDDFTCGLNIFAVGALDDETVEYQRQLNRQADLLLANQGTAPLDDLASVTTSKTDITLPHSFAQLRYLTQRMHALWSTLLGPLHPLTMQYQDLHMQLVRREKFLETVEPTDRTQRHLVPALVGRWVQLRTNHWLQAQAKSPLPVPVMQFSVLFDQMALMEPWEPRFPSRYLAPPPTQHGPPSVATTQGSTISTITPVTMAAPIASTPRSTAVRSPAYAEVFQKFKAMGIRTSLLRERLKEKRIEIPKNAHGDELCLAWHVIGMCNTSCKRSTTHGPLAAADEAALLEWCKTNYTLSA